MKNDHRDQNNDPRPDLGRDPRDAAVDDALKQALRAEDPGAAFTQRVLARAREERAAQQSGRPLHAASLGQIVAKSSDADSDAGASRRSSAELSELSDRRSEVSKRRASEVLASPSEVSPPPSRVRTQRLTTTRKLIAALAASLTFAAAGAQWMQHRRYVAEGERARAQVLAALRLTNEKLDIVQDKITGREHAR